METKKCSKCHQEKLINDFYQDKYKKDGLKSSCKLCVEETKKIYRQNNSDKIKSQSRKGYEIYYKNNSEEILLRNKLWRQNNTKKYKESKKKSDFEFHVNNPNYVNEYRKHKRETNHLYKLTTNLRCRLYNFIKKNNISKSNSTIELIGCSSEEIKVLLERKFTGGMSWDNYGKWHIDHKIPLSSAKNQEELYKLCHFTNLQPMWASDNLIKGAKIL